ncbi:polar amino acid transport system permease protein [Paenarthrobacter nitroguajacolicus]|uniref:amino acid ABC transporter permease n=1 Tax=Paenarthrobacter nitroguajacolicus TaxID=211146 RepID=UPI002854C270|nr:amino acid ABC transporter permease [Paenarthrobacter nitroguajacolicus]MDR6989287.1 polar amino acid transport system permease protein [Paenarthrobacter nitroguajacolicus]
MISQQHSDTKVHNTDLKVQPLRHPSRWIGAAIVLLVTGGVIYSMFTNPRFEWDVVATYLFGPTILQGIVSTINLTVISMVAGTLLGTLLAVARLSPNPILSGAVGTYVWIFRATPILVQLLAWYNLGALYPDLQIGVPGLEPLVSVAANDVISGWTAALLGLSLHQAAYTAEIVRAGILSVDAGQREAATALGMPPLLTLRRVILPQAMRAIIPPMGNEVISMMKTTSLVSVIAVPELLYAAQSIYARTYQTIPLLIVVTFWYLVLTAILTIFQGMLERRYGRGSVRSSKASILQWIQMRAGSNASLTGTRTEQK